MYALSLFSLPSLHWVAQVFVFTFFASRFSYYSHSLRHAILLNSSTLSTTYDSISYVDLQFAANRFNISFDGVENSCLHSSTNLYRSFTLLVFDEPRVFIFYLNKAFLRLLHTNAQILVLILVLPAFRCNLVANFHF